MAEGFGDDTTDVAYLNGKLKEAMKEAELAVSLAPDMASAHRELGDIAEDMLDFRREGTEVARAMELAPNSVSVIMHYALFQAHLGHAPEAVAAATHAAELDPVSWEVYADLATALDYARQPEKALVAVHHAEQLGIGKDLDTYLTGDIELQQGNAAAARQTCAGGQDWRANLCLALAYHALGQQADADSQLANLRNKVGETGAAVYAGIYAQWGRPDDALHWLEEAYRLQDNGLTTILADWALDPIRGTPRFKDIVRRLNFPP
jgi:tetratricopeptide (TPR) repeat protein